MYKKLLKTRHDLVIKQLSGADKIRDIYLFSLVEFLLFIFEWFKYRKMLRHLKKLERSAKSYEAFIADSFDFIRRNPNK